MDQPAPNAEAAATEAATPTRHPLAALHDLATLRARAAAVLRAAEDNVSLWFRVDRERLPALADRLAAALPADLSALPLPGCWAAFGAGGVDRAAEIDLLLAHQSREDAARTRFDLAVVATLLSADPGARWRYRDGEGIDRMALPLQQRGSDELLALLDRVGAKPHSASAPVSAEQPAAKAPPAVDGVPTAPAEPATSTEPAVTAGPAEDAAPAPEAVDSAATPPTDGEPDKAAAALAPPEAGAAPQTAATPTLLQGPPGLAVAALRAFVAGGFSATAQAPLRADAAALKGVDATALRAMLQSTASNPVQGLEARAALLARLGEAVAAGAARHGLPSRPGLLFDRLAGHATAGSLDAGALFAEVLRLLGGVWRGGQVQGLPAGDVWPHRWAGAANGQGQRDITTAGFVPLHRPTLLLAWSLVEPLRRAGVAMHGLEQLPLPLGVDALALLLQAEVIVPRHERNTAARAQPSDDWVVEGRALALALLDELGAALQQRLASTAAPALLLGAALQALAPSLPPLPVDGGGVLL